MQETNTKTDIITENSLYPAPHTASLKLEAMQTLIQASPRSQQGLLV